MKLYLDISTFSELADRMMPEGAKFSLEPYSRRLWLREVQLGIVNDINLTDLNSHDEHRALVGQHLSDLAHIGYMLTEQERATLGRYGAWMEALIHGEILPFTLDQKRFILVGEGRLDAEAEFEKLWKNVVRVRGVLRGI